MLIKLVVAIHDGRLAFIDARYTDDTLAVSY
jgi:hypothetical protein